MKDREAFDLGGAKTKGLINWIFWWETGLAIFSILGAYYVLPSVILTPIMEGRDWNATVCGESSPNLDEARPGFWIFIFCVSSVRCIVGNSKHQCPHVHVQMWEAGCMLLVRCFIANRHNVPTTTFTPRLPSFLNLVTPCSLFYEKETSSYCSTITTLLLCCTVGRR